MDIGTLRTGRYGALARMLEAAPRPVPEMLRGTAWARMATRPAIVGPRPASINMAALASRRRVRMLALSARLVRPIRGRAMSGFAPSSPAARETMQGLEDDANRLANAIVQAQRDADSLGMSPDEQVEAAMGTLSDRAGEVSASMGFPVDPGILAETGFREAARAQQMVEGIAGGWRLPSTTTWQEVVGTQLWDEFAGTAVGQRLPIEAVRGLWADINGRYGRFVGIGSAAFDNMKKVAMDAAAYAEGGLRPLMEDFLKGSEGVFGAAGEWFTGENVRRAGRVAEAWLQVASGGDPASVLNAVGGTISMAGSVVPQPAGAVVSTIGAAISFGGLIVSLFEDPPTPPPALVTSILPNMDAWMVLTLYWNANERRGLGEWAMPADLADMGWSATIDQATGEVLVRNARADIPYYRRVLDVFSRSVLSRRLENLQLFGRHAVDILFSLLRMGGETTSRDWRLIWWNTPSRWDILTQFVGAESGDRMDALPLRGDGLAVQRAYSSPGTADGFRLTRANFVRNLLVGIYVAAMTGGCRPYALLGGAVGVESRYEYPISIGVGGDRVEGRRRPFAVSHKSFDRGEAWGMNPDHVRVFLPVTVTREGDATDELRSREQVSLASFAARLAPFRVRRPAPMLPMLPMTALCGGELHGPEEEWLADNRIPVPSPAKPTVVAEEADRIVPKGVSPIVVAGGLALLGVGLWAALK